MKSETASGSGSDAAPVVGTCATCSRFTPVRSSVPWGSCGLILPPSLNVMHGGSLVQPHQSCSFHEPAYRSARRVVDAIKNAAALHGMLERFTGDEAMLRAYGESHGALISAPAESLIFHRAANSLEEARRIIHRTKLSTFETGRKAVIGTFKHLIPGRHQCPRKPAKWRIFAWVQILFYRDRIRAIDLEIDAEEARQAEHPRRIKAWRAWRAENLARLNKLTQAPGKVSYNGMARGRKTS